MNESGSIRAGAARSSTPASNSASTGTDRFTSAYLLRLGPSGKVQWVQQDDQGRQTVHDDEPDASWFVAFKNWVLSPFVREELL